MLRSTFLKLTASMAALALLAVAVGFTPVRADDTPATMPAGKASITVTVLDKNNAPVADAAVSLVNAVATATTVPVPPGEKPNRMANAIATGKTDSDGKAVLTGIADGEYTVMARLRGQGQGKESVTVADQKDQTVSVTLKARTRKAAPAAAAPAPQN